MKRYLPNNLFYSNCIITAIIIRFRLGGKLFFKISRKPIGIHAMVKKNQYIIDFSPACTSTILPLIKQILFYGGLRVRSISKFNKDNNNVI